MDICVAVIRLHGNSFFSEMDSKAESLMKFKLFFEGSKRPLLSFDVETYSPHGFPFRMEDPIVNFSMALPTFQNPKDGLLTFSFISHPRFERELLMLLYDVLLSLDGGFLVTYNGTKFDVEYVIHRGSLFDFDFQSLFSSFFHVDLYKLVRWLDIRLPRYSQKAVEKIVGFKRVVNDVSGEAYHLYFADFLKDLNLKAPFYNVEDSVGCLQIMDRLFSVLMKRSLQNYKFGSEA